MADNLGNGKFIKQYFVNFSDGAELHAWIFMSEDSRLIYGHDYRDKNGVHEPYLSANERDFFELPDLDRKVTLYLSFLAMQAKAKIRVVEFSPEASVFQQIEAMENAGMDSEDVVSFVSNNEEIRKLEELWNRSCDVENDYSSIEWLLDCVHKWEKANKEKGRFVEFFGSFFSVDPKDKTIGGEDRVFVFGLKKTILGALKEITGAVKKEKDDFINW